MKKAILCGVLISCISVSAQADVPKQTATPTATPPAAKAIPTNLNCDYKIPAESKTIDKSLVTAWAEKAITQAFDFDSAAIDAQLQKLEACFTEQGWQGFNSALQKSGNIEAIKTQKLTVSSQVDGKVDIADTKENQWKLTVPLQVVYQNDKEKVTQLLNLTVSVGRKPSGDLGILQIIATPRNPNNSAASVTDSNNQPAASAGPVVNNTAKPATNP